MKRPRVAALILVGSVLAWGAGRLAAGATEVSGGAELEVAWTFDTGG